MALDADTRRFNAEIEKFAKNLTPDEVVKLQKKVVFDALNKILMRTPVDTGRARGNWQVSIANYPFGEVRSTDRGGGTTTQKGAAALANLTPFQVVYIANNLPYIQALENGSSKQSPQGMMAVTYQELRTMFR